MRSPGPTQSRRIATVLAAATFAAACTEISPTATAPGPVQFSSVASSGQAALFPANQRYSDTSKPNATGRSGSATLTARALLGKDGTTFLEATTGPLDSDLSAPGNLDKVQVKAILDPELEPLFTENHNKLTGGGAWSAEYSGLPRGLMLQVQGNVSGIDRNRKGVITLQEPIKLRPDMAATVSAPDQAEPNTPVAISGLVAELNGDVGADADCVLRVDGAERDRADGIWVDAGGAVTCTFAVAFDAPGSYELTFSVEGVTPGDFDGDNNMATDTVEVAAARVNLPLHGWAGAADYTGYRIHAAQNPFFFVSQDEFDYVHKEEGRWQWVQLVGTPSDPIHDPVRVDISETTDGTELYSLSLDMTAVPTHPARPNCRYTAADRGLTIWVCSNGVQVLRNAGDVTYYSAYYGFWTGSEITVYSWNSSWPDTRLAAPFEWGSEVTLSVAVEAQGAKYTAGPSIPLSSFETNDSSIFCSAMPWAMCFATEDRTAGRNGTTTF